MDIFPEEPWRWILRGLGVLVLLVALLLVAIGYAVGKWLH